MTGRDLRGAGEWVLGEAVAGELRVSLWNQHDEALWINAPDLDERLRQPMVIPSAPVVVDEQEVPRVERHPRRGGELVERVPVKMARHTRGEVVEDRLEVRTSAA